MKLERDLGIPFKTWMSLQNEYEYERMGIVRNQG